MELITYLLLITFEQYAINERFTIPYLNRKFRLVGIFHPYEK